MTRVEDLRTGDVIKASWLGSGWHKVYSIEECGFDKNKMHLNIEGFGNVDVYKSERVERK